MLNTSFEVCPILLQKYAKTPKKLAKLKFGSSVTVNDDCSIRIGAANIGVMHRIHPRVSNNIPLLCSITGWHLPRGYYVMDVEKFYKDFCKQIGLTPSKALSIIKRFQFSVLCDNFEAKYMWASCTHTNSKMLNSDLTYTWCNSKHIKQICLQDNQLNLLPLCIKHNLTPKQLKDSMSSACWKKICNNTLSRNSALRIFSMEELIKGYNIPTTLLRNFPNTCVKACNGVYDYRLIDTIIKNKIVSRSIPLSKFLDIVHDTCFMAEQLTLPVNFGWSMARWGKEHNVLAKRIQLKDYPDILFDHTQMKYAQSVIYSEDGEYIATLLNTPLQVANEGYEMNHCVASYAYLCSKGKYFVYSVTNKDGSLRSTLGFYAIDLVEFEDSSVFDFKPIHSNSQHYEYNNQDIVDRKALLFGVQIIDMYINNVCALHVKEKYVA